MLSLLNMYVFFPLLRFQGVCRQRLCDHGARGHRRELRQDLVLSGPPQLHPRGLHLPRPRLRAPQVKLGKSCSVV